MTDKKEILAQMERLSGEFMPFYWRGMQAAIAETEMGNNWFPMSLVRGSDPQPFSSDRYHAMLPYSTRQVFVDRLEELTQIEWLERVGEDAYILTDLGRSTIESIFAKAHEGLNTITVLPTDKSERLADLLQRIVAATLEAPEPADKWSIAYSRWTDPGADASPAARIDQYITDLHRYRDDAHVAAWRPYDVSGHTWEIFTFIWRDRVATAAEMAERMEQYRRYTTEDYQAALDDLAARGWVVGQDGRYQVTDKGHQLREEAEEATDRYFFVGWDALDENELAELGELLEQASILLRSEAQKRTWDVLQALTGAIPGSVRDEIVPRFNEYGLNEPPGAYAVLLHTEGTAPDPISADTLGILGAYTRPARFEQLLAEAAEAGFIEPVSEGQYVATEKGRDALHKLHDIFYTKLGEVSTLADDDLVQAEALLQKVIEASATAEEPEIKWGLTTTRRRHPEKEYPPLARIDHRLDDLRAFRDDVHLAAWQPSGVSGYAWEALTFIWRDTAHTAEKLAEQLPNRGYNAEDYEEALQDLASRGWVEQSETGYQITEKGRKLRQQAEGETDRLFFAPWSSLTGFELGQMYATFARLSDDIRPEAEEAEEEA
jgi:predicted transcriptional regulator